MLQILEVSLLKVNKRKGDNKPTRISRLETKPRRQLSVLKASIFCFLETRNSRKSSWYHRLVVALIIASLGLGIANSVQGVCEQRIHTPRLTLEILLLGIFSIEYVLRVWSSGAHGTYGTNGGWKKYLLTPHMILDALVVISSLVLVTFTQITMNHENKRFLYLLLLLRILRIDRQRGAFIAFSKVFKRHRKELLTCWYMGFLMVIFVSFIVYALEKPKDNYTFDNLFNGVYWGVISLTTIGYGDINPETPTGKILICCFAIFGTCFLAMPAGIIGSGFALQVAEKQKEKHVSRRRRPAAVMIQSCWRKYAADNNLKATWLPHIRGLEERSVKRQSNRQAQTMKVPSVPFKPMTPDIAKQSEIKRVESVREKNRVTSNGKALWCPRATLTTAEKTALRFVRLLKVVLATKKFRQARRPYDERDILDQFATSQVEMFAKLRDVKQKFEDGFQLTNIRVSESMAQIQKLTAQMDFLKRQMSENNSLLKLLLDKENIQISTNENQQENIENE